MVGLIMRLLVFAGQVLPDCRHRQSGICSGQPELSGAVHAKQVFHRGIGIAQSPKRPFGDPSAPRFSQARRGR
ncbi:MAG: hypothetical protein GDA36_04605 [Rhodobacteraceae bacterium]|nr:hypothetical protein [Paracoccaceae bacterium]